MAKGQYSITDVVGRTLSSGTFNGPIDIGSLSEGVYLLHASYDGQLINEKFIKQ